MMDHPQSASGNGEDNVGIPDDLRCKRSDGKQWRCTAMSMPDKTVCEKHYIQAKKRAANSAMRASMKKGKRNSMGESDIYLESKSDDYDMPIANLKVEHSHPISGKKYTKKASKDQIQYSPETPPMRNLSTHNPSKRNGDSQRDFMQYEENWSSYKISPVSAMDSSRNRSQRSFDINATAVSDYSSRSTESSEETEGKTCHQCRRNIRERLFWCLRCERRGYCDNCISKWYSYISLEDIQKICPACRGTCTCKVCLRGDNLIKMRIKEIPVLNKLQHLHSLLSSVLPIIKRIHCEQCFEVELEKKIRSTEIDLNRTKLNVDEQMCCNFCRIPIVDYHRQCANCSYDLCLSCSQDLREASASALNGELVDCEISDKNQEKETVAGQQKVQRLKLNFPVKFPYWKANSDGSIPCPPKEYGGCGYSSLNLCRIFKMNWVAKLVKNVEEMVGCCRIYDTGSSENIGSSDLRHCQYAHGQGEEANFLYSPSSDDIKSSGIGDFRKHWARGEPIIVKEVFDSSTVSTWDPVVIRSEIRVAADEKLKEDQRMVKAIDCFNWSEVNVELDEFIRGFSEGRRRDNGWPQMLKLRDWPSPTASEEFLLYQRPEFISKLPLVEYIHPRWGFLNVAAKLPHYSLQNDAGPKIFMSYGSYEELGRGDCVTNLHFKIRDMVYLLVHSCEVKKLPGRKSTETEKVHKSFTEDEAKGSPGNQRTVQHESRMPDVSLGDQSLDYQSGQRLDKNKEDRMADQGIDNTSSAQEDTLSHKRYDDGGDVSESNHPGVLWDVFHRRDVPKLLGYLRIHWNEFGGHSSEKSDLVTRPLYDETLFLNKHHIRKLKEEFEVEPWSFKQHAGQAVFVPAGCPFQVRNLQSTVQLGLDFLFPESLGEAVKLAEEIRCLPNDHEAKLQVLEVEKISLYAASSAIKEVQKLVLDPKLGTELGFGDLNLTAAVSENLERMTKRKTCA